ncbi:MAG: D-alanine--D-alanine ligase [Bacteroidales bacterium]|nr:D-alanine--D-alanine ligase [Bacteroidales bacterium]
MNKNIKIYVVCGGVSTEREVSLRSGDAVALALKEAGYTSVTLFDLTSENLSVLLEAKPDLAFITLHGKGGEDGCIQGALELSGIAYVGSGVLTSAVCMNKISTKRMLACGGLPTAPFCTLNKKDGLSTDETISHLISAVGLPMVLKSPEQGSSIGVVIVHKQEDMAAAIKEVYSYGDELLAEKFLDGVELTLPILGTPGVPLGIKGKMTDLHALPIIEITSEREFYDYTAKYTQGLCHHIIPARISEDVAEKVREIGLKAYRLLGCRGFSRIDFIVDKKLGPMVIEANTIPGMTSMSLVPDAARADGIEFPQLVDMIVRMSLPDIED